MSSPPDDAGPAATDAQQASAPDTPEPQPAASSGFPPPPPPSYPAGGRQPRLRIYRAHNDGEMVAGVCAGLARATNTDPILFRIVLGVLTFFGGVGALIYLLAWLFLPADGDSTSPIGALLGKGKSGLAAGYTVLLAASAALVGIVALDRDGSTVLLVGALALGVGLLLRRGPRIPGTPSYPNTTAPTGPHPYSVQPDAPFDAFAPAESVGTSTPQAQLDTDTAPTRPTSDFAVQPSEASPTTSPGFAPHGPYAQPVATAPVPSTPPRRPRRERSPLGRLTLAATCLVLGGMAVLDVVGASVPVTAYMAATLAIAAGGLLVGAFIGRARGLIALGIVATLALGGTEVIQCALDRVNVDETRVRPHTVAQLERSYDLEISELTIDLRDPEFVADLRGKTRQLDIDLAAGDVRVHVPNELNIDVRAEVGAGALHLFNTHASGLGLERRTDHDGAEGAGTLTMRIKVGVGDVRVSSNAQSFSADR